MPDSSGPDKIVATVFFFFEVAEAPAFFFEVAAVVAREFEEALVGSDAAMEVEGCAAGVGVGSGTDVATAAGAGVCRTAGAAIGTRTGETNAGGATVIFAIGGVETTGLTARNVTGWLWGGATILNDGLG